MTIEKTKPPSMGDSQWKWKCMIKKHGSEAKAEAEVVKWLRDMADDIEKEDYPHIFSATKDDNGTINKIEVITSYPWCG